MTDILDDASLDRLFRSARSTHAFKEATVSDATLNRLYDLLKWGPTAFNAQPARYVFVRSEAAKARLLPTLSSANREKTSKAPVTVIVAYDSRFFESLAEPNARVLELFTGNGALAEATAFRNGTLQGAYLIIAARALGLAVGPMSGFDADALDREFFPDGRYRANFLVNVGYPDDSEPRPRGRRLAFGDVADVI
ncbi:MAG: 3-hydroxypropanoate dehydrogenase [Gammaproteobacteria bacterium]|jgi:3-hydroxypropanoate dehydrogenase|nr:3-hydroxypropanoate dehydrogenase [Gammaproteobacteria bacterium]